MPERCQRKRTKGWRLPANGRCVTRPSLRFGNPFRMMGTNEYLFCDASHRRTILPPWVIFDHEQDVRRDPVTPAMVAEHYRRWLHGEFDEAGVVRPRPAGLLDAIRRELRGKDLYCYCPAEFGWCHGAVLLELANG